MAAKKISKIALIRHISYPRVPTFMTKIELVMPDGQAGCCIFRATYFSINLAPP